MANSTVANPGALPDPGSNAQLSQMDSDYQSQISSIDSTYDPQIAADRQTEQDDSALAIGETQKAADYEEGMAKDELTQQQKLEAYVKDTPDHQQIMANAMHGGVFLSLLMAVGGAKTRLTGGQLLAAETGIVQGSQAGGQQAYDAAFQKWKANYDAMKDHISALTKSHTMMLDSYKGRADAYQKATEAARRMTGDELDQKQQARLGAVDTYKLQMTQWDKYQQVAQHREAQQEKMKLAQQKKAETDGLKRTDRAEKMFAIAGVEVVDLGPAGRNGVLVNQRLNAIEQAYPDKSPTELVQMMKDGFFKKKMDTAAATQQGKREQNLDTSMGELLGKGQLFDQLREVSKNVGFGSAKFTNNIRLAMQHDGSADPDVAEYVQVVEDSKIALTGAIARGSSQTTDKARGIADAMFPTPSSQEEMERLIERSTKVMKALKEGNARVREAITTGKDVDDIAQAADAKSGPGAAHADRPPVPYVGPDAVHGAVKKTQWSEKAGKYYVTYQDAFTTAAP